MNHAFKSLPSNSIAGLLYSYHHHQQKYFNAVFLPEINNHHIILRLHLDSLIDVKSTRNQHAQELIFHCYMVLQGRATSRNTSLLTIHVSIVLYPRLNAVIHFFKNFTKYGRTLRFNEFMGRPLVFHVPLPVIEGAFYMFSYKTKTSNGTVLKWPVWPLPLDCIRQYSKSREHTHASWRPLPASCSTNKLQALTAQQLFIIEREALSTWLSLQYNMSNMSFVSLNRRSHPFERATNTSVCPLSFQKWILRYQDWHTRTGRQLRGLDPVNQTDRAVILNNGIRFVLFETFGSGIADRITHLISTYLVAILTNRFLLFDDTWVDFHQVMRSSLDYQAEVLTPWIFHLDKVNAHISSQDPRFFTVKSQITREERTLNVYDYDREYPERILLIKSHTGNTMHTLTSAKSVYSQFLREALQMTEENLFGCLYHSLIIPRLSMLVDECSVVNSSAQYILQKLMFPKLHTIGIQIRVGDSYMTTVKERLFGYEQSIEKHAGFFDCAKTLLDKRGSTVIYLISDSLDLRLAAFQKWPYPGNDSRQLQIITSSNPVKHISYSSNSLGALQLGMFETFLFSLCDVHIITASSGFGRFSAFNSLQHRPIYSFSSEDHPVCSYGEGQVTFMRAGHQWSGV